jgi:hypothetical protein
MYVTENALPEDSASRRESASIRKRHLTHQHHFSRYDDSATIGENTGANPSNLLATLFHDDKSIDVS